MTLVVGLVAELLLAVGVRTGKGLLLQMNATMRAQIVRLRESLAALQANVRLFVGVGASMGRQMNLLRESLATVWTAKRLLASVNAQVHFEVAGGRELLGAVLADVGLLLVGLRRQVVVPDVELDEIVARVDRRSLALQLDGRGSRAIRRGGRRRNRKRERIHSGKGRG